MFKKMIGLVGVAALTLTFTGCPEEKKTDAPTTDAAKDATDAAADAKKDGEAAAADAKKDGEAAAADAKKDGE